MMTKALGSEPKIGHHRWMMTKVITEPIPKPVPGRSVRIDRAREESRPRRTR